MSERGQQEYLADMREAIVRIQSYVSAITSGQFLADHKTQDAVIRNIEILGEATKHVPATLTRAYPEIEWKSIAGMRDKLVHDYFGVNLEYSVGTSASRSSGVSTPRGAGRRGDRHERRAGCRLFWLRPSAAWLSQLACVAVHRRHRRPRCLACGDVI